MPPQAQAIELLCRCDDIPDDGVELRVLKGLLTAATSSATHLHGQVCDLAAFAGSFGTTRLGHLKAGRSTSSKARGLTAMRPAKQFWHVICNSSLCQL